MPVRPTEAVTGIVAAVADGSLTQTRLNEAAVRVLALRATLSRTPTPGLDVIDSAEHRAVAAKARQAING